MRCFDIKLLNPIWKKKVFFPQKTGVIWNNWNRSFRTILIIFFSKPLTFNGAGSAPDEISSPFQSSKNRFSNISKWTWSNMEPLQHETSLDSSLMLLIIL